MNGKSHSPLSQLLVTKLTLLTFPAKADDDDDDDNDDDDGEDLAIPVHQML
jgi:hypothetical protein